MSPRRSGARSRPARGASAAARWRVLEWRGQPRRRRSHRGIHDELEPCGRSRPRGGMRIILCVPMSASLRDQLRQAHFLESVNESALHQLAKLVEARTFETDAILFSEGAKRRFMAIIVSGAVAIEKSVNGRPVRLVTLGAGEAVGEGVLLDDAPHGTTARALQPTEAYTLSVDQLEQLIKEHPALYAALVSRAARAISHRLAATDATLVGRGRTIGFTGARTRREHDMLGDRDVPDDALYGIQTLQIGRASCRERV